MYFWMFWWPTNCCVVETPGTEAFAAVPMWTSPVQYGTYTWFHLPTGFDASVPEDAARQARRRGPRQTGRGPNWFGVTVVAQVTGSKQALPPSR